MPLPLAQTGPDASTIFYLTLLFIFLTGIVTTVVTKWSRDKCLRFFDRYHVTVERIKGQTTWGVLKVFPSGIEVLFDHPYVDTRGRKKTSYLMYQADMDTQLLSIFRYHDELTPAQQERRLAQVHRTFNPGPFRRLFRRVRNFINLLRDAFASAIGAVVGQAARMRPGSAVLTTQAGSVTQIGQALLGKVANAYEPLLEQYIGQPVIVDVADPANPAVQGVQYTGYLADYTQGYVTLMNVQHTTARTFSIPLPAYDPDQTPQVGGPTPPAPVTEQGVEIRIDGRRLKMTNTTDDLLIARQLVREGFEAVDLGTVIPPRGVLDLPAREARGGSLALECVRTADVTAPRRLATVRHAGELLDRPGITDFIVDQFPLTRRG